MQHRQVRHPGTGRPNILCLGRSVMLLVMVLASEARAQDTTTIYQDIERYAAKHKFTRWVHGTIFVPPEQNTAPPAPGTPKRRQNPLARYKGRIVRSVDVQVLDPFGTDLSDSTAAPEAWVQRAGNSLHRRTREYLVREFVLVKKNETFDPMEAAESERLLRASPMVNDARVLVVPVNGGRDTVDVRVIVLDKWSIEAWADISTSSGTFTVIDRNLLGLGQELRLRPTVTTGNVIDRLEVQHAVYNIKGTYISTAVDYAKTEFSERLGLVIDRPFYSPLARWAGAVGISQAWNRVQVRDGQGELLRTEQVEPKDLDTWFGYSFPLAPVPTEPARSSAIVAGIRYAGTRYTVRPGHDSIGVPPYPNSDRLLMNVGLSVRQYYRERYLYRFGAVEDVPEGMLITLTGGYRDREAEARTGYTGIEFARGRHYIHFGYLTAQLAYGTFWERGIPVDANARIELRYFTDLFRVERWYLRQFITLAATHIDRKVPTEQLDLNGDLLFGFRSAAVAGTHRQLLKLETVAYAPWHVLGFRFAPVLLAGFGTIGGTADPLFTGRIHTSFGLGILIRNENLLVKTFEVSFSFYPYVPEENGWVFDAGRFTDLSPRFSDFAFTRPKVVGY